MRYSFVVQVLVQKIKISLLQSFIFLLNFSRRHKISDKTIVIIRNDQLGDFIVSLPVFHSLRIYAKQEKYRIVLLTTSALKPLAEKVPFFDEIIPVANALADITFWDLLHDLMKISRINAETVFNPISLAIITDAMTAAIPAENKIKEIPEDAGITLPTLARYEASKYIYTQLLPTCVSPNVTDQFIYLICSKYPVDPKVDWNILPDFLSCEPEYLIPGISRYCVLVPGAGALGRQWPIEYFIELISYIKQRDKTLIFVITGTKKERILAEQICRKCPDCINLCGQTSLVNLGKLLKKSEFVVANETGTAHYASFLGIDTLVILGCGDFEHFLPCQGREHLFPLYVQHLFPCQKCHWTCSHPKYKEGESFPCISAVNPELVENAYDKYIA